METIDQEVIDAIGFDADKAKAMTDIVVKKKEEDEKNHYIKNILPKTLENIFSRIKEEITKGNSYTRYNFPPEAYKQQIITKVLESKKFKIEYCYDKNDYVISW